MITAPAQASARQRAHDATDGPSRMKPDNVVSIPRAVTRSPHEQNPPSVKQVARVVATTPAIGAACDVLRRAGWRATIAGNRITVEDSVFAQFVGTTADSLGNVHARWMVYATADTASEGCCDSAVVSCPILTACRREAAR